MPYYFPLRWNFTSQESQRTARNLLALRHQIGKEIPARTVDDTFLLATWNIRDFDSNKFGHGPRLKEAFFYIAEIISAFDMVALQEINEDLTALKTVMRILGEDWDYITTDKTEGRAGNQERMAFVYDTRKVHFRKIAGELVLPRSKLVEEERQFARTPFLVAFQSGWFSFMICTVHILFGSEGGEGLRRRIAEIESLAEFLSERADDESANYIVLGDFNIVSPEHQTMEALRRHGFFVPPGLENIPSNLKRNRHYDQIGFKAREGQVQFANHAGVLNFYQTLFTEQDAGTYLPEIGQQGQIELDDDGQPLSSEKNLNYYLNTWRTYQMSDHLPMWVELKINFSKQYLQDLLAESFAPKPPHPLSFSMPELES
jgi:endonuclease/exonuclease/phosphatase family metal-dependent hydrolase